MRERIGEHHFASLILYFFIGSLFEALPKSLTIERLCLGVDEIVAAFSFKAQAMYVNNKTCV